MKKYIILISGLLIISTSCNNELDLKPFNASETSVAFTNLSSFQNAVLGAYRGLLVAANNAGGSAYANNSLSTPDALADNLITNSQGRGSQLNFHYWNYTPNNTWAALWRDNYAVINRVNAVLENIDKLPDGAQKNNIRGEALALRAMCHFDLVRVFGKAPKVATASDLGVPYVTSTDPTILPSRNTVAETYALLIADMEQAKGLIAADNGVGRLNSKAVNGLLSRIYLTQENWAKVIESSTAAITAGGSNLITSMTNFPNIWKDASNQGILFKIVNLSPNNNITVGVQYSQTGSSGVRSEFSPNFTLYSSYTTTDLRKSVYFTTSAFSGILFNHVAKHFGKTSGNANVVDIKYLRWEEIYLNRAEAYANTNQDPLALADLNSLRSNRYSGFVAGTETGQALKDAIDLQRRLEFAFEGHRFYDLKRKGLSVERTDFGDRSDGTGTKLPANALVLISTSPLFQLPIPQAEIAANPNLIQNPGY